jgi:hypothetical protein
MDVDNTASYLGWQTKVAATKDSDHAHVSFNAEDRLAFLKILIGSTTYDIITAQRATIADGDWQVATSYQRQAEDNRLNAGFPNDAYAVFERLAEPERAIIRQNLRKTLLVTTTKHTLGMYLPIQVLFQIIEDADTTQLFPTYVRTAAARRVASYDQISGLFEWLIASDINNDTSTVYDLCAELVVITCSPNLLKIYRNVVIAEAQEFRNNWNDNQREAIQRARKASLLKGAN